MTPEQIREVLEMPEDDQLIWCAENAGLNLLDGTLADLAFRRRDETDKDKWLASLYKVYELSPSRYLFQSWAIIEAKPIHSILAAIQAKEDE